MSIGNLHRMLAPRSVAVIGPSTKPQSVGAALMHSLLQGGSHFVLPIRPEDEPALRQMASGMDVNELWHEFFSPLRDGSRRSAARLSQIDDDRETLAGLARMTADQDFEIANCAILVRDWSHGLARELMRELLEAAAAHGIRQHVAVLPANHVALFELYEDVGFSLAAHDADPSFSIARRATEQPSPQKLDRFTSAGGQE
jgi:acetyltransferase